MYTLAFPFGIKFQLDTAIPNTRICSEPGLFHHIYKYISTFAAFGIKVQCRNDRIYPVRGLRNIGFRVYNHIDIR